MPDQMPDTDRRRIPVDVITVYHRGDKMARDFRGARKYMFFPDGMNNSLSLDYVLFKEDFTLGPWP